MAAQEAVGAHRDSQVHIESQKWMSAGIESRAGAVGAGSTYNYAGLLVPQKNFPCSRCGKSYGYKKNLWRHQKYECGKQPLFQCPFCPTKTSHKCNLMTHIRNIHHAQDYDYEQVQMAEGWTASPRL